MRIPRFVIPFLFPLLLVSSTVRVAAAFDTTRTAYGGGPILHPHMDVLYWGNVTPSQRSAMNAYLQSLAQFMSGAIAYEGAEPTVAQYGVLGASFGSYVTDTAPAGGKTTISGVQSEIAAVQSRSTNKLAPYGWEELILVFTGSDVTITDLGACAKHQSTGTAGQYFAMVPINQGTCPVSPDDVYAVTSHEIFEAATDPGSPNGWTPEIGDPCRGTSNDIGFGRVQGVVDDILSTTSALACTITTLAQASSITATTGTYATDIFAWDSSGRIEHQNYQYNWYQSWQTLSTDVVPAAPPVSAIGANGSVNVFVRGTDGNIHTQSSADGASWPSSWTSLGGPCLGQPSVTLFGGYLNVFCFGTDGNYYSKAQGSSGWPASWTELPTGPFNGAPSVVPCTYGNNTYAMDVVGWGVDGTIHHIRWPSGTSWDKPWPATFIGSPVVACGNTVNGGSMDIVGQGTDWKYYHGTEASGYEGTLTGGPFMGPPAVLAQSSYSDLDVVGELSNTYYLENNLYAGTWYGNGFGGAGIGAGALGYVWYPSSQQSPEAFFLIEGTDNQVYYRTSSQGETWSPSRAGFNSMPQVVGGLH